MERRYVRALEPCFVREGDWVSWGSILLGAWWHSVVHSACVEAESTSQSIPLRLALFHRSGKTRREAGAGAHRLVGQAPGRSGQAEQGRSPKHQYPGMWSCKAQSDMVMISLGMAVTVMVSLVWML